MLHPSRDYEAIRRILTHSDIWDRISDKNHDRDSFVVPQDENITYLLGDGAVFILHPYHGDLVIHANVLKEHRESALIMGRFAISWAFNNTSAKKVMARVPLIYPDVAYFGKKCGMNLKENDKEYTLNVERHEWVL